MPRAHFYAVAQDPAGNAQEGAVVRVLQPGTVNVIAAPIYATDTDVSAMTNPFTTSSGQISFYIDTPQRVRLGITPVNGVERFIEDIDVGSSGGGGGDSDHTGGGTGSTRVGLDSASAGADSLAVGQQANSGGTNAVAVGQGSTASGLDSTSLGSDTTSAGERGVSLGRQANSLGLGSMALGGLSAATADRGTAVGDGAVANSARSSALGANSTGNNAHSTAVGSEAATTEPNQIRLGTTADVADAPGGYVLTAVDGKRGRLRMLPDGQLTTTWHVPSDATNLLPTDEQGFEAGIGAWAAVSGLTVAQSAAQASAGSNSLLLSLTGAGAASARSSKVAAVAGTVYVGLGRMFHATGEATPNLDGTLWLEFYDGSDVLIGSATAGRSRKFFAGSWIWFDVRAVAPAGTATVALRAGLPTGGGVSGDDFYLDEAGVFPVAGTV